MNLIRLFNLVYFDILLTTESIFSTWVVGYYDYRSTLVGHIMNLTFCFSISSASNHIYSKSSKVKERSRWINLWDPIQLIIRLEMNTACVFKNKQAMHTLFLINDTTPASATQPENSK